MKNGLYKVQFRTPKNHGVGVARVEDGKLSGGDGVFFYIGTYSVADDEFSAEILVKRHSRFLFELSIFDAEGIIKLHGDVSGTNVTATGTRQDSKDELSVVFSRLAD